MDIVCGIRSQNEHRPRSFFSLTHPEPEMCETFAAQPSPTLWSYLDSTRTQIHKAWRNHQEAWHWILKGGRQRAHIWLCCERMSPCWFLQSWSPLLHIMIMSTSACGLVLLNSSVLTVTHCVFLSATKALVRAHAILVREILPKEMFCVESRVCKLTNWLTLYQRRLGHHRRKTKQTKLTTWRTGV